MTLRCSVFVPVQSSPSAAGSGCKQTQFSNCKDSNNEKHSKGNVPDLKQ